MTQTTTIFTSDQNTWPMYVCDEKPRLSIKPTSGWAALNLRETWEFRDLLMSLASRDLKLRYKQTVLGVLWVVLQPLMSAAIFAFVFGKVAGIHSQDKCPYFLIVYVGMLGWNLFNGTLSKASNCLVGNSQLISKVFFPRLVLPLSTIPSVLIDFGVALGMLVILMLFYHQAPGWALLLLPLWIVLLLMFAMGAGLCAAALAVSYRDINYILPVLLQALLFASPIPYQLSMVPAKYRWVYPLNPLSGPLEAFRWSLLNTAAPPMRLLVYSGITSVVVAVIGAFSFKRMERQFADVI